MKKRILSILLSFCMMLMLLPVTALAEDYPDGWPDDPSALIDGDIVTIDDTEYTYKGEADTSGIDMAPSDDGNKIALQEACCWKAGDGYVLYKPTVETAPYSTNIGDYTTSAEVTLHDAEITSGASALRLPYNKFSSADPEPVPVIVHVEGENSLTTSGEYSFTMDHDEGGDTTFTGGGTLTITLENDTWNFRNAKGDVTINDGTQVTISGGSSQIIGNLTVTGSDSKLTIDSGTQLIMGMVSHDIDPNASTVTMENGTVLENNGTLSMWQRDKEHYGITGEISGGGGIVFPSKSATVYALVDDVLIAYGGDIGESGLNISGKNTTTGNNDDAYKAPTEMTRYKAGDGYALFTPQGGGAKAKLELHGATINTTGATALNLPTAEPVDITVTGDNSLTAGGGKDVISNTNGQVMSVTGSGNLTLAGTNYGVNGNGGGAVSISIDGDLTFDTVYQPISTGGDVTVSAKRITSKSGYYFYSGNGTVSLTATDGDIVIDDTGREFKQEKIKGTNGITLNALNGKIDITHGRDGCYALNSSSGTITVTASNDVIINASLGGGINSGKNDTSDVVSVNSTNGSIQMSCGDNYKCVQVYDATAGGVALAAAKDITLNGTESGSVAIQTSSQDVRITAGGKLSSTTAYGFQVGTLTIKADEVSIAGTSQDGIQASSVSITNTDGTNNCKSVSITATSGSDSWAAISSSNVTIKADDVLICGNNSAKAINAQNSAGTVTIGDAGMIIGAVSISGTPNINPKILMIDSTGDDASIGLNLSTPPSAITYYKAGDGYALFTPAKGDTKATLTLHNASITSGSVTPLKLGAETVIKLEGANSLENSDADSGVGIKAISSTTGECQPVTIQGGSDDSLTVSAWQCTTMGALTIDGCSVTMNGKVYGILTEGNVVLKNGAKVSASGGDDGDALQLEDLSETEQYSLTVSGGSTLIINNSSAGISGDLIVSGIGSKVSINSGVKASVEGTIKVENSGVLENNGVLKMKLGTTPAQIVALKLTGSGIARVLTKEATEEEPSEWTTYTNEGVAVKAISGGLDLTSGDHSTKTLQNDGYSWTESGSVGTLTLGNITYIQGNITFPDETIIINSGTNSIISGTINAASGHPCDITFTGAGSLTTNGIRGGGTNGDTITVAGGADVTVNGSIFIGGSGAADGTLNVSGSGTTLTASAPQGYAIDCDTVNVDNGASLNVHAQGENSMGILALTSVKVTNGATLTAGCDYGVYIIGGKLTVDSSSKLITNGAVAPFCVVDKSSSKHQSDILDLSGIALPSDTKILSAKGTDSGCGYTYWSLVPTNGSLSVSEENATPATLTGAVKGKLTFVKADVKPDAEPDVKPEIKKHSSDGGVTSTGYSLAFDTNDGSAIASLSKASGSLIYLKEYKPTRDAYDFAGWYSDEALTKKVTSITLTKNTTVYAKWTETAGQTKPTEESTNENSKTEHSFTDVSDRDYYYDAVQWAVEKGITSGTTSTSFSPDIICTRGQMVAFLWRAMGSPQPTATDCPFTDVSKDAYYYKAVLWAVENGITSGTTATNFSPNATVTRGQTVTFLWRAAGKPVATAANPYTDVTKGTYNYDAILWASEKGITQGTTSTTFSPDTPCTRGQIVSFLYRYM